jgi:hypothetical protein
MAEALHVGIQLQWRNSLAAAWQTPPREIALSRLARAEALGMSYHDYTSIVLDRGVNF